MNNTPGQKKARVDAFTPVLVNIAGPEQTAMIDNPYGGWWIPDDRGERYNIAKRIYVLWTREGLERTRKMELLFLLITAAYGEQTVFISSPAVPTDIINGRITGAIGRKVCGLTP